MQDVANSLWAIQKLDVALPLGLTATLLTKAAGVLGRLTSVQVPQVVACLPKLAAGGANPLELRRAIPGVKQQARRHRHHFAPAPQLSSANAAPIVPRVIRGNALPLDAPL